MWERVGDQTELQYIDPHSYGHQRCVFLVLQGCSAWRPSLLDAGFLYRILSPMCLQTQSGVPKAPSAGWWLSLPHLVSNSSDLQLTDFLSTPSYIIVQSPTQSLEWHVWSSSSGNNCHAVHRSLSSGASVYECTMEFYLVPFCQPSPPTQFFLITAIGMCHFLPVHHFGMACLAGSKVNIQHSVGSFSSGILMLSWFSSSIPYVICLFLHLILSMAEFSVPISILLSWQHILIY